MTPPHSQRISRRTLLDFLAGVTESRVRQPTHFAAVQETQERLDEIGALLMHPMADVDAIGSWAYENTIDTVLTSVVGGTRSAYDQRS